MKSIYCLLLLLLGGCAVSPIPKDIMLRHQSAHDKRDRIEHLLQPGDVVFRKGNQTVAGGIVHFSNLIAQISDSDFSHAVIVYDVIANEAIIADVSEFGLTRYYLVDWLILSQRNVVVKRLKPEFRHYIPLVLDHLRTRVEFDPLYDEQFGAKPTSRTYCTGLVDECFRESGLPLADKIAINRLPRYNEAWLLSLFAQTFTDLDVNTKISIVGNEKIGMFSSLYLETVVDLR